MIYQIDFLSNEKIVMSAILEDNNGTCVRYFVYHPDKLYKKRTDALRDYIFEKFDVLVLDQKITVDGKIIYKEKGCDKYRCLHWFSSVRKIMHNDIIKYNILEEEKFKDKMTEILRGDF